MSTFVFGSGFRPPEARPVATPGPGPEATASPGVSSGTMWTTRVTDALCLEKTARYDATSRAILEGIAKARGYRQHRCHFDEWNLRAEAPAPAARDLSSRWLDLSWSYSDHGRRRDLARELVDAGYTTFGLVADAGVDGLRQLKFPIRIIGQIAKRLAGHGLELKPAEEGKVV
jgi:hypothetical protein